MSRMSAALWKLIMLSNPCVGSWSARRLRGLSLLISQHIWNHIINFCLWNLTLWDAIECKACYVYTAYMYIYTFRRKYTYTWYTCIYTYMHTCMFFTSVLHIYMRPTVHIIMSTYMQSEFIHLAWKTKLRKSCTLSPCHFSQQCRHSSLFIQRLMF